MPGEVTVTLEETPAPEDVEKVFDFLRAFNLEQAGPADYAPLFLLARDEDGTIVGGMDAGTYWGWLYLSRLAVAPEYRKRGVGTALLKAAEAEAVRRGCKSVYLDTFSFQARGFYEKYGYRVFGTLEDFPPGHRRFFLTKRLSGDES